jgi:hypothetical protein
MCTPNKREAITASVRTLSRNKPDKSRCVTDSLRNRDGIGGRAFPRQPDAALRHTLRGDISRGGMRLRIH